MKLLPPNPHTMTTDQDYDDDGNNIVPCPLCLSMHCPSKEGGKCPDEAMFAIESEIRLLLSEYRDLQDDARVANVLEAVDKHVAEREAKVRREERERVLHTLGLWWINGNIGVSSKAIFMYMTQNIVPRPFDAPHDESDRKRCVRLLRAVPEWVDRLSEIEAYKIEGTSNGKKVMPWNVQIPLIREALTPPTNH